MSRSYVAPGDLQAPARTPAFLRRVSSAGKCLASAKDALQGFERGAHIFGLTKGQFSMIDLADAVLSLTGPASVTAWTWAIADYEAEAFGGFLRDNRIVSFRLVCDWSMAQRDLPLVGELQSRFGLDSIRVSKNHAKIITIGTADGWRVVVRGSMNLNANPRHEQFDVSDDPEVFRVVADLESELWSRGKPLPVSKLKHSDATDRLNASEVTDAPPAWAAQLSAKRWW